MSTSGPSHDLGPPGARQFVTTHWSVVLAAGRSNPVQAQQALETLCRVYWYPLYAFVRRQGRGAADAQDLTQEFFTRLIEKRYLGDVDRAKGRFRSFLLASLKHFLANEWDKARAQKRGGGRRVVPLDVRTGENRYALEPSHDLTPDRIFERRWALTLLDEVLKRLREEYTADGKAELFEQLKVTLTGEKESPAYAGIASRLSVTEGAVKVSVHRLRRRYRELLLAEIANTVVSPDEVEEELQHLCAALSS